jgi:hypothetical protein
MMFLLLIAAAHVLTATPNAREIVQRSIERDPSFSRLRDYTFHERSVERSLDSDGQVTSTKSEVHEVLILFGEPYGRLIEKDGKPLPPDQERKEQEKLDKFTAKRQKESERERQERLEEIEKRRKRGFEFLREILDAYDFQIAGEDQIERHPVWVVAATPRPGYKPKNFRTKFLTKLTGTFWIEKDSYEWMRVQAEVVDTASFGLGLARLHKGSTVEIRQSRDGSGAWLPKSVVFRFSARLALVKKLTGETEITFDNYRRFQTDSRVLSAEELPPQF